MSGNIKILQTVESNTALFNFLSGKDVCILLERPLLDLKSYGPKLDAKVEERLPITTSNVDT